MYMQVDSSTFSHIPIDESLNGDNEFWPKSKLISEIWGQILPVSIVARAEWLTKSSKNIQITEIG